MLPPEYFEGKEERLLSLYQKLENFILRDITRRLLSAGEMTATADRLIWKLKQMGESRRAVENKLSRLTGLTRYELKKILREAIMVSWADDKESMEQWMGNNVVKSPLKNPAVIQVMDAEYKKSLGELQNLTRTTMNQAQNDLINMLDEVDLRVASGVQSYSAAVCDILDRYAGRGIYVDYPSGTRRTLEAAVRCCVVTSINQTAAQVTNQYIIEGGCEYVLVSAYLGARVAQKGQPLLADHSEWQGRVYKIKGSEQKYPNLLESTGYNIDSQTGQGTVVNPLGLHGYNCRHSHKPWDTRLKNPYVDENGNLKIDSKENRKRYELQQKQRAMERAIRKTKRQLVVKEEEINCIAEIDVRNMIQQEYDKLSFKITQQNKKYNDFCKANNLQPQYDRTKIADVNHRKSTKKNEVIVASNPENIISGFFQGKKVKNFTAMANEMNQELDLICVRKSKWSGKIILDSKINGLGEKEWNCDIKLVPKADYATELHELLHARSISYFDKKTYENWGKLEEGTVQLLTEEICKQKQITFTQSYVEQVEHLRRINKCAKLFAKDIDFAKELINIPVIERMEWLIKKVNGFVSVNNLTDSEVENIYDSLSKLLGGF